MWARTTGLASLGTTIAVLLACSPDRTPDVPNGTPSCEETCDAAWVCGGVLENDLETCKSLCDEELHGEYRVCIAETACEMMYECKVFGPADVTPEPDPPAESE